MTTRLPIVKTHKLYIGGAFPRSESGRSFVIADRQGRTAAHGCRASRKDLRDAVGAARKAQPGWAGATAYNRGQVLYRMAEMLEGKGAEFAGLLEEFPGGTINGGLDPAAEVAAAVDRLVAFAGWADKYGQVLGCQNAVAGPYWNITVPQPTGVVGVVCPSAAPLLGLVAMLAPVVCSGNAAVVVSPTSAPVVCTFGEVCATSDVPGGVVNLLTGDVSELVPVLAKHRDLDGVFAAQGTDGGGLSADLVAMVREGTADNLKRVKLVPAAGVAAVDASRGTAWVEPFVEFKTVWHPVGA